jgi:hypothetical protein
MKLRYPLKKKRSKNRKEKTISQSLSHNSRSKKNPNYNKTSSVLKVSSKDKRIIKKQVYLFENIFVACTADKRESKNKHIGATVA